MVPMTKGETTKILIYRELRASIITGKKKPGERLSIDVIKEMYGTSVTPVRDALQMLNQEGLITILPRSGYYITQITLKELRDMLELREILESAAAEKAAKHITAAQIDTLKNIHQGYSGDDDDSYTRYTDENRSFHYHIAEASQNRELAIALGQLMDRLARFMVIRQAGKLLIEIHTPLLERLEAHDPDGARKAIQKELRDSKLSIMERILDEEAEFWHLGSGDDKKALSAQRP